MTERGSTAAVQAPGFLEAEQDKSAASDNIDAKRMLLPTIASLNVLGPLHVDVGAWRSYSAHSLVSSQIARVQSYLLNANIVTPESQEAIVLGTGGSAAVFLGWGAWQGQAWPTIVSTICLDQGPLADANADLSQGRMDGVLKHLEMFPICYNQTLLRGSLVYCKRALRRGGATHDRVYSAIKDYVEFVDSSVRPFLGSVPAGWSKLDFTLYEDRFETIQELCRADGILPTLDDLTIEDVREG
jgi:hypothetical protein